MARRAVCMFALVVLAAASWTLLTLNGTSRGGVVWRQGEAVSPLVDADMAIQRERVAALRLENEALVQQQARLLARALDRRTNSTRGRGKRSTGGSGPQTVTFRSAVHGGFLSIVNGMVVLDPGTAPPALRNFRVDELGGGWVALVNAAAGGALEMVPPQQPLAWVVRTSPSFIGTHVPLPLPPLLATTPHNAKATTAAVASLGGGERQQWRIDIGSDGQVRLFNRGCGAFINAVGADIRGHSSVSSRIPSAADEPSTAFHLQASDLLGSRGPGRGAS